MNSRESWRDREKQVDSLEVAAERAHALEHLLAAILRQLGGGALRIENRHIGGSHAVAVEFASDHLLLRLEGTA